MSAVFRVGRHAAVELSAADLPRLQAFYEANDTLWVLLNGCPPPPTLAQEDWDELPPPHLPFGRRWFLGLEGPDGALDGVVMLLSDFCAAGVWHLSLFHVATRLHGSGFAHAAYRAMEDWAVASGAAWLRLAVAVVNTRGGRFWARCGYTETRRREQVDTGVRRNDMRVMAKPLAGGTLAEYLALLPRDAAGSPLP